MEYYQEKFQNCSFLSIGDVGEFDLPACLKQGHVFYERTPEEVQRDEGEKNAAEGNNASEEASPNVPLMGLNATKAGMTNVNVDQINKQIMQISEGSKFHEHKKKQQEKVDKKVQEMKRQLENFSAEQIQKAQGEVDALVRTIEADMDLSHYYVHIDMDAFFASVEMRDDPSLKDVPMAVGSDSMLSTSNYVARTYGVRAAMPGFIAKKLCPELKIVPCNFPKYQEASKMIENALRDIDRNMFMCMDEADLDITDIVVCSVGDGMTPEEKRMRDNCAYNIVSDVRKKIKSSTKLTASAGIAPTRFLAKLCSDMRKPDGQMILANRKPAIMAFLSMIPVRKVCGIGAVTEQMLKGLEIENCRKLWQQRAIISLLFKRASFQNLLGISIGTGSSVFRDLSVDISGSRKSLSCERTFIGTSDLGFLENLCKSLCSEIEKDLKTAELRAKTITLKIKTTEYDVKTRARSIIESTDSAERIFQAAWRIYLSYVAEISDLTIRLMGVRVSSLHDKNTKTSPSESQKMIRQYFQNKEPSTTVTSGALNFNDVKPSISSISDAASASSAVVEDEECTLPCPVCDRKVKAKTTQAAEMLMDIHIDECLSRRTVREVRSKIVAIPLPPPKKRAANLTAANEAKKVKRTPAGISKIDSFFPKV